MAECPTPIRPGPEMSGETISKEERILRMIKRVLTEVAKDTSTPPGVQHPLRDETIQAIRECLSLVAARERELGEESGRANRSRPEFIDEPKKSHVVTFHKRKHDPDKKGD